MLAYPADVEPHAAHRPDSLTLAAFGAMVLVGGTNFVAVRFSNFELPPFWGAATRFGIASLLFLAVALARHAKWPRGRALVGCLLYGVLGFGLSYAFLYFGLVYVQAGLAAVILSLVPLATVLLAVVHRIEKFRWLPLLGALVAAAGVGAVYVEQIKADIATPALVALLIASLSIAEAGILIKWFPRSDPMATNAIGMAVGSALLLGLSRVGHETWILPSRGETWLAFLYLATVGSFTLFFLFLFIISRWTASATSFQFVLTPLVAVALGFVLARETITWVFVLGGLLVLMGVYVGALASPPRKAEAATPPAPPAAASPPAK